MPEWIEPVTNRTGYDITVAKSYLKNAYGSDGTLEEKRACFNTTDINRIENDIKYLSDILGLGLTAYEWNVGDIPTVSDEARLIDNVQDIVDAASVQAAVPAKLGSISDFNTIENALKIVYESDPQPPSMMPHMDGVTNYYDCTKDVTVGGYWLSQVDCYGTRYDMPLGGNISIAEDGSVTMTGDSNGYAWFTTKTTDPRTRTVYLVAKTDHDTTQSQNPMLFGCISLYSGSGAFNIATYRMSDIIIYDSFGSPFINGLETALDYHVIALVRDGSEYRMYVDGDFKGSCTNDNTYFVNSQDGTHVFGVGCLHSQSGYYNWGDKVRKYFKFVAVADAVHSAAQIAENAAWLRSHFGLD